MDNIKKPRKLKLYKALKIGYLRDKKKQAKVLKRYGYRLDTELSNGRETLVAYNPFNNKVLFIPNGTDPTNERDLQTDLILAVGGLRQTSRYMDTKKTYNEAKKKYSGSNFILASHSLGGGISNYVAQPKDKVINYNPAYPPNATARPNVTNYRTQGDIISAYAPKQNTITLEKPRPDPQAPSDEVIYSNLKQSNLGQNPNPNTVLTAVKQVIDMPSNLTKPHNVSNIQNAPIFV